MIRVPENLIPYVTFENNKIKAINLPNELRNEFEKFKEIYEKSKKELTDY